MRNLNDPRQSQLFDVFQDILSPVAYRRLTNSWQNLFRCDILQLMPAGKLAGQILHRVTAKLVELLELDFSKQRLDSTHIKSNMVKFGRVKFMATASRGFLN